MNGSKLTGSEFRLMKIMMIWVLGATLLPAQQADAQQASAPRQSASAPAGRPVYRQGQNEPGSQQLGQQQSPPAQEGQVRVPLVNTQQAVQEGLAQTAQQPFPQLTAGEQQFLDGVLDVWEKRTESVKRYECDFKRWQYDPTKYEQDYFSRASGSIKYMQPDKGMFVVDRLETIAQKEPSVEYKIDPRRPHGEYWICDGQWIYIRDRNEKKEEQYELPPQLRGEAIHLSPLPFLFGVKASEVKQRYWIRPIQAPPGDDSVWLEAWPKWPDDAGNYSRVQVVLDRADILPRALIVFLPNWRAGHEYKEIYEFSNRVIPKDNLWDAFKEKVFREQFIPTKLPSDWTIIKHPYVPAEDPNAPQGAENQARVAQPPPAQTLR